MKQKIKFDPKSLKFKLWLYFAVFALLLMVVLWFLQILFLNYTYQDMKIRETTNAASIIQRNFGHEDFIDIVVDLSITNDMYIHIETFGGSIIFSPETAGRMRPSYAYISEMAEVRTMLLQSAEPSISVIIPEPRTDTNTLAYATFLVNEPPFNVVILYIFSPLYPVASTIAILRTQLIYVTLISIVLALAISFYLSRRIAKPIRELTSSAKNLAGGNYNIRFTDTHYTEIADLANTLTYAAGQLEKTDTLQKGILANVSHDLRTPLTMVKSYAEMIRDLSGDNPEKRNAHLNVIIEEADRLNLLVGDILTLSSAQSGALPLTMTHFNLKNTVANLLQSYDLHCEREGCKIILSCHENVFVTADQEKIKQVVSNLLNNALKYCGDDKRIIISIKKIDRKVRLEVIDYGIGIPQNELPQIWERYYKAHANHIRSESGTGLGLSIVKQILILHNAEFGVESKLGEGSTFWFELSG